MTIPTLRVFLWGALAMASLVAGLGFLRLGRISRDRLFYAFTASFWLMAGNWIGLALVPWVPETRHHVYVLRLLAFVVLAAGIIDKNRRAGRGG